MDADNAVAVRIEVGLEVRVPQVPRVEEIPTVSATPASSISAAASPIVLTIVHCSPSNRLWGSSAL